MKFLTLSLCILLLTHSPFVYLRTPQSKRDQQARRHLERADELESRDDPHTEQEYRLAIRTRERRYPEALQKLSWYLQHNLRFSEAAAALKDYIQQTPREDHSDDIRDVGELRHAASLQKRVDSSAEPKLDDLLEYVRLVNGYATSGDAVPYAERAVKLYPSSGKAYVSLARLLRTEEKDRQFALLQKAAELDPQSAETHSALGWYYFSPGRNLEKAVQEFRKALDLSGGQYADAWQGLGHVLTVQGQKKEAIEAFRSYLRTRKSPTQLDKEVERLIEQLERSPQS